MTKTTPIPDAPAVMTVRFHKKRPTLWGSRPVLDRSRIDLTIPTTDKKGFVIFSTDPIDGSLRVSATTAMPPPSVNDHEIKMGERPDARTAMAIIKAMSGRSWRRPYTIKGLHGSLTLPVRSGLGWRALRVTGRIVRALWRVSWRLVTGKRPAPAPVVE